MKGAAAFKQAGEAHGARRSEAPTGAPAAAAAAGGLIGRSSNISRRLAALKSTLSVKNDLLAHPEEQHDVRRAWAKATTST